MRSSSQGQPTGCEPGGPPCARQLIADQARTGRAIVFVHGLGDDWRTWSAVAAALSVDRDPIALDVPWRAGGDHDWRRAGTASWWLARGLAELDAVEVVLVGHSFGANAVLELLATEPPAAVSAAVLIAPTYLRPGTPITWSLFDGIRATFQQQVGDGIRARLQARASAERQGQIEALVAVAMDRIGPSPVLAAFEQFTASAHLPLSQVSVPMLVLAGGGDPGFTRADVAALTDRLPLGSLGFEEEYDHFAHRRRPAQVAAQIEDYLNRSPASLPVATAAEVGR